MKQRFRDHGITLRSLAFALATLPLSAGLSQAVAKPTVEVAFVLDTTGSMGGLIEGAKRKIWSIATAIVDSNPDAEIRMGLVSPTATSAMTTSPGRSNSPATSRISTPISLS